MKGQMLVGIQVLRGCAALAVVLYHCNLVMNQHGQGTLPHDFFFVGIAGVDVFFCLSGFLMVHIIRGGPVGPREAMGFLMRRALRIVPLYWLLTAVKLALLAAAVGLASPAFPGADFILRSFLFIPVVNFEGNVQPVLAAGWTLVYEWFFYVMLFLGMLVAGRAAPLAASLVLAGLVVAGLLWPFSSLPLATYADPIVLEFIAGMAIGALGGRLTLGVRTGRILLAGSLALFALSALPAVAELPRILRFGLPSALLLLAFLGLEQDLRRPVFAPLRVAGDSSYSIYLCHQIVQAVLIAVLARLLPTLLPSGWSDAALLAALLVLPVAAGLVLYATVERPMTRRLMRWASRSRPAVAVQAA